MNESVDRRVVEMRFDNKDFEKNVQATIGILDKLKQRLSFNKAADNFNTSGFSAAVDTVKDRFSALEVIGVTALANITNSAVNAGKQLVKSLTIDQVKAGFSEYELKMGSIQTIMASTGEDLSYVNQKLGELNEYSDKTIYSFSDMTNSIGKFTNAGVSLDVAVAAIQGISNEAAVSGANANEASRAMYNFAQALSAGYVKLIDWKSIENANMATVEFKQQLIDSAVAAGTLEKQLDGTYKVLTSGVGGGFKETITATKNFNDSLSAAWMTTDVLTSTLSRYSDATTDIGAKAFAAAQDVKTFSQLMDTIKESIGSGWAQTFEIIFGDLEEAKKLWTSVNNVVSGFISASADARNTVLQTWKDLGGREDIARGIKEAFKAVHDAYVEVFPPATTEQLQKIGEKLKSFTKGFADLMELFAQSKLSLVRIFTAVKDVVDLIKDAFAGLFEILSGGENQSVFTRLYFTLINFVSYIAVGISSLIRFARATGVFVVLHDILLKITEDAKHIISIIQLTVGQLFGKTSAITPLLEKIAGSIRSIMDSIDVSKLNILESVTGFVRKVIGDISAGISKLAKVISKVDFGAIAGLLAGGGVFAGALKFSKFIDSLTEKVENVTSLGGLSDAIKDTFSALTDSLSALTSAVKATTLTSIATAMLELAVAMVLLASIDSDKLGAVLLTVGGMFTELAIATKSLLGITDTSSLKQMFILSTVLSSLSKSLLLMAIAVKILSTMDWQGLAKGLIGLGGILFELKTFMASTGDMKAAKGFVGVAVSLVIMAKALAMLGALEWNEIGKGLAAVAGILFEISIFSNSFNSKGMLSMGISMNFIAASMLIFAKALKSMSEMSIKELIKGLSGMAGVLIGIAAAMKLMPKGGLISASIGILAISGALTIITDVLAQIGALPLNSIIKGLGAIGVVLIELVAALTGAQGTLKGAASLIVAAFAVDILASSLVKLSEIEVGSLIKSLVALGAALGILIGAGLLAGMVAPGLLVLSVAIAAVGMGTLAAGTGIMLVASGLALLITSLNVGMPILMTFFVNMLGLIPEFAKQIGLALLAFLDTLTQGYDALVRFGVTVITATIDGIIQTLPKLVELVGVLINTFATVLLDHLPTIIDTGIQIMFALLDGITDAIPDLVDKAFTIIITFIDSMSSALDEHGTEFWDAVERFVVTVIKFLFSKVIEWANVAKDWLAGLLRGFAEKAEEIKESVTQFIKDKVIQPITELWENFKEAGANLIRGFLNGLESVPILGSVIGLGKKVIGAFNNSLGEHSPSKLTEMSGEYFIEGFVKGINENKYKAVHAVDGVVKALDINGKRLTIFDDPIRAIKLDAKKFVEKSVEAINWGEKTIRTYIDKFGQTLFDAKLTFDPSSEIDFATKSIAKLSKTLYLNSQEYRESNEKVQEYINSIKQQEDYIKALDKEIAKQQKAANNGSEEAQRNLDSLNNELEMAKDNLKDMGSDLSAELTAMANGAKDAFDTLRTGISDNVKNSVDILKVSVNSYVDLFTKFQEVENIPVERILKSMRSQIVGVSKWRDDLIELGKRGIADGLLDQLKSMGVDGEKYIRAFLKMTDEELSQANLMFRAKNELTSQTLIDGMKDQFKAIEKWTSNIELLAKKGINFDLLMDLQEAGPDNAEYVQALADMTADQIEEVNKLYKKSKTLPTSIADRVLSSLALSNEGKGNLAGKDMASALAEVLGSDDIGEKFTEALAVGIKNSETTVIEASKVVGESSLVEFNKYFSTENGSYIAVNMVNGLANGLITGQSIIADASRELARAAYDSTTDELGIHSPSKAFEEIGRFSDMGLANGLLKYSSIVNDATNAIGDSALSTMKESMDKISALLNNEVNNPVITPTLDLSDISNNAGRINKMFDNPTLGTNLEELPGIQNGKIYNFTQNNYSPKALSRIEIYRQSKNLFSTLKGTV